MAIDKEMIELGITIKDSGASAGVEAVRTSLKGLKGDVDQTNHALNAHINKVDQLEKSLKSLSSTNLRSSTEIANKANQMLDQLSRLFSGSFKDKFGNTGTQLAQHLDASMVTALKQAFTSLARKYPNELNTALRSINRDSIAAPLVEVLEHGLNQAALRMTGPSQKLGRHVAKGVAEDLKSGVAANSGAFKEAASKLGTEITREVDDALKVTKAKIKQLVNATFNTLGQSDNIALGGSNLGAGFKLAKLMGIDNDSLKIGMAEIVGGMEKVRALYKNEVESARSSIISVLSGAGIDTSKFKLIPDSLIDQAFNSLNPRQFQKIIAEFESQSAQVGKAAAEAAQKAANELRTAAENMGNGFGDGVKSMINQMKTMTNAAVDVFKSLIPGFISAVDDQANALSKGPRSFLSGGINLARMMGLDDESIKAAIIGSLGGGTEVGSKFGDFVDKLRKNMIDQFSRAGVGVPEELKRSMDTNVKAMIDAMSPEQLAQVAVAIDKEAERIKASFDKLSKTTTKGPSIDSSKLLGDINKAEAEVAKYQNRLAGLTKEADRIKAASSKLGDKDTQRLLDKVSIAQLSASEKLDAANVKLQEAVTKANKLGVEYNNAINKISGGGGKLPPVIGGGGSGGDDNNNDKAILRIRQEANRLIELGQKHGHRPLFNFNHMFEGLLRLPDRISFTWWKINNFINLVQQLGGILTGAFNTLFGGLERFDQLKDLSEKLAIEIDPSKPQKAIEQLDALSVAAKLSGTELASLSTMMRQVNIALGEAEKSAPNKYAVALKNLGFSIQELRNGSIDAFDVVKRVGQAFRDLPNDPGERAAEIADRKLKGIDRAYDAKQRAAIVSAIAGRGGDKLLALSDLIGTKDLGQVLDVYKRMGFALSSFGKDALQVAETGKIIRAYWDPIQSTFATIINQLNAGMAPAILLTVKYLSEFIAQLGIGNGSIKEFGRSLGLSILDFVIKITDRIDQFKKDIKRLGFGDAFTLLVEEASENLSRAAFGIAGKLAPVATSVGVSFIKGIAKGAFDALKDNPFAGLLSGGILGILGQAGLNTKAITAGGSLGGEAGAGIAKTLFANTLRGAITGAGIGTLISVAFSEIDLTPFAKKLGEGVGEAFKVAIDFGKWLLELINGVNASSLRQALVTKISQATTGFSSGLRSTLGEETGRAVEAGLVGYLAVKLGPKLASAFSASWGSVASKATADAATTGLATGTALRTGLVAGLVAGGIIAVVWYLLGDSASHAAQAYSMGASIGNSLKVGLLSAVQGLEGQLQGSGLNYWIQKAESLARGEKAPTVSGQTEQSRDQAPGGLFGLFSRNRTNATSIYAPLPELVGPPQDTRSEAQQWKDKVEAEERKQESARKIVETRNKTIQTLSELNSVTPQNQPGIDLGFSQAYLSGLSDKQLEDLQKNAEAARDLQVKIKETTSKARLAESAGDSAEAKRLIDEAAGLEDRANKARSEFAKKHPGLQAQLEEERQAHKAAQGAANEHANALDAIRQEYLASSEAFDIYIRAIKGGDLAGGLVEAEAAAKGLRKGLGLEEFKEMTTLITATKNLAAATSKTQDLIFDSKSLKEYGANLQSLVAQGYSYADAQKIANAEKQKSVDLTKLEASLTELSKNPANQARVEELREAIPLLRAQSDEYANITRQIEAMEAVLQAQDQNRQIAQQINLQQQFNDGLISEYELRLKMAALAANGNQALADQLVLQEQLKVVQEQQQKGQIDLADGLKSNLKQIFDVAIDSGDFNTAIKDIGKQWGRNLFESTLEAKIGFDSKVKGNLLDLGNFGGQVFKSIFGLDLGSFSGESVSGGSGVFPALNSEITSLADQVGNIAGVPGLGGTLTSLGIGGLPGQAGKDINSSTIKVNQAVIQVGSVLGGGGLGTQVSIPGTSSSTIVGQLLGGGSSVGGGVIGLIPIGQNVDGSFIYGDASSASSGIPGIGGGFTNGPSTAGAILNIGGKLLTSSPNSFASSFGIGTSGTSSGLLTGGGSLLTNLAANAPVLIPLLAGGLGAGLSGFDPVGGAIGSLLGTAGLNAVAGGFGASLLGPAFSSIGLSAAPLYNLAADASRLGVGSQLFNGVTNYAQTGSFFGGGVNPGTFAAGAGGLAGGLVGGYLGGLIVDSGGFGPKTKSGQLAAGIGSGVATAVAVPVTLSALGAGAAAGTGGILAGLGSAATLAASTVVGIVVAIVIAIIAALVAAFGEAKPSHGTVLRRYGESVVDKIPTFKSLQEDYGDITRKNYRPEVNSTINRPGVSFDGSNFVDKYGKIVPTNLEKVGAGSSDLQALGTLFAQNTFGGFPGARAGDVASQASQWANIFTEFMSRGIRDEDAGSKESLSAMREKILQSLKEMGIDSERGFNLINAARSDFFNPNIKPGVRGAIYGDTGELFGKSITGFANVLESELPKGVHVATIALEELELNGVKVFENLTAAQRDAFTQMSEDQKASLFGDLGAAGAEFNAERIKDRILDITASAKAVGENLSEIFKAKNIDSGISAFTTKMKDTILEQFQTSAIDQLLDTTSIGGIFEKSFGLIRQLQNGEFNLNDLDSIDEFGIRMRESLIEGRRGLLEYQDRLEAIRQAVEDAQKLRTEEDFVIDLEIRTDQAKESLQSDLNTAIKAGFDAGAGAQGLKAFGDSIRTSIREKIATALFEGLQKSISSSGPLASLLAKYGQMVNQAFEGDNLIDANERAGIVALIADIKNAGSALINSTAPLVSQVFGLISESASEIDTRIKEIKETLTSGLSSSLESFSSQFIANLDAQKDQVKNPAQAFADTLYESVRGSLIKAIVEAFTQGALIQGALAPLIEQFSTGIRNAMVDGVIDAGERASLKGSLTGIGGALQSTLSFLLPMLEDFGSWIGDTVGFTSSPNVKGGKNVRTENGDLVVSDNSLTSADRENFKQLSSDQRSWFIDLVNNANLSYSEANRWVLEFSRQIQSRGIDVDQSLRVIAEYAREAGISFQEAANSFSTNAAKFGFRTNVGVDELTGTQYDIARNISGKGLIGREDASRAFNLDTIMTKAGIGMAEGVEFISNIMKEKGLNTRQAVDYFIAQIVTGGYQAKQEVQRSREVEEEITRNRAAQRDATNAWIREQSQSVTEATNAQKQAISTANLEYANRLRAAGLNETEVRAEITNQLKEKDPSKLLDNIVQASEALKNPSTAAGQSIGSLGSEATSAAGKINQLGAAAEGAANKLTNPAAQRVEGKATGGYVPHQAVVGEGGKPELVTALPGGGFHVTPLSWSEATQLMNGGAPAFARGGCIGEDCGGELGRIPGMAKGGCAGGKCGVMGCAGGCKVAGMAEGGTIKCTPGQVLEGGAKCVNLSNTGFGAPGTGKRGIGNNGGVTYVKSPSCDGEWLFSKNGGPAPMAQFCMGIDPNPIKKGNQTVYAMQFDKRKYADYKNAGGKDDETPPLFLSSIRGALSKAVQDFFGISVGSGYKDPATRAKEAAQKADSGGGGGGGGGGGSSSGGSTGGRGSGVPACNRGTSELDDVDGYPWGPPGKVYKNTSRCYDINCRPTLIRNLDGTCPDPVKASQNKPKAAATGGWFGASGSAVVGEAGMPELVEALPGGGFRVTPLSWNQAASMLGSSVPGMASGGTVGGPALFGNDQTGTFIENFAKNLKEATSSSLADAIVTAFENSAVAKGAAEAMEKIMDDANAIAAKVVAGSLSPEEAGKKMEEFTAKAEAEMTKLQQKAKLLEPMFEKLAIKKATEVKVDFKGNITDFLTGGSAQDFEKAINESVYNATVDGLVNGLLAGGPIKDAIEFMNYAISENLKIAMEEGVSPEDMQARFTAIGEAGGEAIRTQLETIKPAIEGLGKGLGVGAQSGAEMAKEALSQALTDALTKQNGMENFAKNMRTAVFKYVQQGMVQAFIDAALINGALGPMLEKIKNVFSNLNKEIEIDGKKVLVTMEKAFEIAREEGSKMKTIINDPGFKQTVEEFRKGMENFASGMDVAAYDLNEAATNVTDSVKDGCGAECEITYRVAKLMAGKNMLDALGREGSGTFITQTPLGPIINDGLGKGGAAGANNKSTNPFKKYVDYDPTPDVSGDTYQIINQDWVHWLRRNDPSAYREYYFKQYGQYPVENTSVKRFAMGGIAVGETRIDGVFGEKEPEALLPLTKARDYIGDNEELKLLRQEVADLKETLIAMVNSLSDRSIEVPVYLDSNKIATAMTETSDSRARARKRFINQGSVR